MKILLECDLTNIKQLNDIEIINKHQFWKEILDNQYTIEITNDEQREVIKWNEYALHVIDSEIKKRGLMACEDWELLFQ